MRKLALPAVLSLLALAPVPAALAGSVDCSAAMAQQDINQCLAEDWQAADAELNRAYKAARARAAEIDSLLELDQRGAADSLKAAQRAWIVFRDAACATEGFVMRGGSAEPMLVYGCLAGLTRSRTADLLRFAEGY